MTVEVDHISWHPAINAALNGSCFALLVRGRILIARGDADKHKRTMLAAFVTATVFLSGEAHGTGQGRSKKEAEHQAAQEAYLRLQATPWDG